MTVLFNMPWQQAFDGSGNTLAGAKLYFYQAGTSTPANVYSDVGLGVPLSNPVIANGAGRFPPIYLEDNAAYKVRYCSSEDVEIWTADNVVTTSTESDVTVVLQAITQTSISAGYTEEEAQNPTNFVRAVYKYANSSYWFTDEGSTTNSYILEGVDDYTRPIDYFAGMQVWFYTTRANTGAATVNVASLGTKNICHADGSTLFAEDIIGLVHLIYNGSSFIIENNRQSMYPVGSIYSTIGNTNPHDILGFGTWETIATSLVSGASNLDVYGNGSLGILYKGTDNNIHEGVAVLTSDHSRDGDKYNILGVGSNTTADKPNVGDSTSQAGSVDSGTMNKTIGVVTKEKGHPSGLYADTSSAVTIYVWKRTE